MRIGRGNMVLLLAALALQWPRTAVALDAPHWVAALYIAGRQSVGLHWIPVPGATAYKILRSSTAGANYRQIAVSTMSEYVDGAIEPGLVYFYVIQAAANDESGAYSPEKSVTVPGPIRSTTAPPTWTRDPKLQAIMEFGKPIFKVALTWEKIPEAVAYNVYRSTIPGKGYRLLTSITRNSARSGADGVETQVIDTDLRGNKIYHYVLTALDGSYMESAFSEERRVAVAVVGYPPPILRPKQTALPQGVKEVRWAGESLSINAEKVDLLALLGYLEDLTRVPILVDYRTAGTLSVSFASLSLQEGIARVLQAADPPSFAAEFSRTLPSHGFRIHQITIVPKREARRWVGSIEALVRGKWTEDRARYWMTEKFGGSWEVWQNQPNRRFDSLKGRTSQRYRGAPNEAEAREIADKFLAEIEELLEVKSSDLQFQEVRVLGDHFAIDYLQAYGTVRVDWGRVFVDVEKRYDGGQLEIHVSNQIHPDIKLSTEPKVAAETALELATALSLPLLEQVGYGSDENFRRAGHPPQLVV